MPQKDLIKIMIDTYASKICREEKGKSLTDEEIAQKVQGLFAKDFKQPTQEEIARVEAAFASTPEPDRNGEIDPQDSKYTPLSEAEKERRRALQPLAVKSLSKAFAAHYNKNVDSSNIYDPRQAFTLLHPDHKEEHQQFLDDWGKSKGNEKEEAKLLLKAAKWYLEKKDDEMFHREPSDAELVEKFPEMFRYSIGAGELSNAFKENSPLVKYGLISEKERQVMGREINKMYDFSMKIVDRMEQLANPLYAEVNLDDVIKNSDDGSTQKFDKIEKVGDFGHALAMAGRIERATQYRRCMDELREKYDCHEKECTYFNLEGKQIEGEELENTVRRGDMFLLSDASREGRTMPCMWTEKTDVLVDDDAVAQMRTSDRYPAQKPSGWHRFLNAISPKLLRAMYGEDAAENVKRWKQKDMVMRGYGSETYRNLLSGARKQSLELKPDAKEARAKRGEAAAQRQRQAIDARKADMKEKRAEMMEKARSQRGLDNNLENMERDCIHELSEIAGNGTIRTYDEDLRYDESTPLLKIAGRALFLSHLQDVQKNGTPEQKQVLDNLDREGFEKLYDNYTKTDEFRNVRDDIEGKDLTLAFMIPLNDIGTINGAKYKNPSAVGEKEFKAFQSMIDCVVDIRKDTLRNSSYIKPFDLKAELGKMAEQKQSDAQKVKGNDGPVMGGNGNAPETEVPKMQ